MPGEAGAELSALASLSLSVLLAVKAAKLVIEPDDKSAELSVPKEFDDCKVGKAPNEPEERKKDPKDPEEGRVPKLLDEGRAGEAGATYDVAAALDDSPAEGKMGPSGDKGTLSVGIDGAA